MKHQINLSFQLVPVNHADSYAMVDEAIAVVQNSGVKHEVTAFATLMEGKYDQLMEIVQQASTAAMDAGAEEILVNLQLHLRKDQDVSFEEKTEKFKP